MVNEKSSNRDSAIYTKTSDLQQLEKELEILRQKRKSRRCSQNTSTIQIIAHNTKAEETPKDAPSPTTLLSSPSPKKKDAVVTEKEKEKVSPPPPLQLTKTVKEQDDTPTKMKSEPEMISEATQSEARKPPAKPKRHENRPVPIITNLEKNEPKVSPPNEEPHSILLKKLQSSNDKRDNRKLNRIKSNKAEDLISNERDLTEELLLTAFSNLNSQSTPTVGRARISTSASPLKKIPTANLKSSFSSRPAPTEKVPSWKKQSSLKKLQSTKGKVSTAINALENGKPATSYRINKQNKPPRPLAEYKLPSPYHQQPFSIGITRPIEVPATTIRSPSDLNSLQPLPLQHRSQQQDKNISNNQTIQLSTQQSDLTSSPIASVNPLPRRKQPSCNKRKAPNRHAQKHSSRNTSHTTDGLLRPLPSYTPQLSPMAGECDHNLTSLLPSPKPKPKPLLAITTPTLSTSRADPSPPPPTLAAAKKTNPLPPTPPLKNGNHRSAVKPKCPPLQPPTPPPHHWHVYKQPPLHPSVNNNNHAYRQLRVINIDNKDTDTDTALDASVGKTQRDRPEMTLFGSTADGNDSSDDSSLSDHHDHTMPAMNPLQQQQQKRYSHDSGYADLIHQEHRQRSERQKKVSFSSVVTTMPTPPATLSLEDYPENTRGFWEAFSAEMGHHHYQHQPTLLDKLDAMKQQQQQRPSSRKVDDATTTSNNNKLINKFFLTKPDQQSKKKTWWKGNNNDQWNKKNNNNKGLDTSGTNMDDRRISQSPPLNHPTKHRPKKPASFRKKTSSAVVPEPQWRQRVPVPSSKQYPRPHPHIV